MTISLLQWISSLNEHSGSRQLYSLPPSQNPAWTPIQTLYLQISVSRHSHKWPLNTHRNYLFVCVSSKLYEFGIAWRWIALDILSFLEYEHVKMLSTVSVNNNIILHWLFQSHTKWHLMTNFIFSHGKGLFVIYISKTTFQCAKHCGCTDKQTEQCSQG